jgi:hypothetical protein
MITAVRLATSFTPGTITLAAGQKFEVLVSTSVAPTGSGFPQPCASGVSYPVAGGMLSVTCPSSGDYMYIAERPGSTTLSASVRPKCAPGQMCPQWITEAALTVTIT